jgi:hypothetical protein
MLNASPGWPMRLLKTYWKRLLLITLLVVVPGGYIGLAILATAWILNWSNEMTALFQKDWEEWKKKGKTEA